MPRKKTVKPPPFKPYWVTDDEGIDHYIDIPLVGPPQHYSQIKSMQRKIAICDDISRNPEKWDLSTPSKFAISAEETDFASPSGDDSRLRKNFKHIKGLLSLFTIYNK